MCTQFFISHEFFTLCKGENEKRLKGGNVGHGQTDRWKDGHLREFFVIICRADRKYTVCAQIACNGKKRENESSEA